MSISSSFYRSVIIIIILFGGSITDVLAQDNQTLPSQTSQQQKRKPTKKEILQMKADDIMNMSFEEVDELLKIVGVSSLEELLNLITQVASSKGQKTRESPGVISIITAQEIQSVGARDMVDILHLIPGFGVVSDIWGTVNPTIRGIHSAGRISFLIDGNEIVERLYSTVLIGNHYPIDQIERIEIIRGPGSAVYGGTAELAVINIVTKKAQSQDSRDISMSLTNGEMSRIYGRRNVNASFRKIFENNVNINASLFWGNANRSDQTYSDLFGTSYDMATASKINTLFFNVGLEYKKFSLQFLLDDYNLQQRDHYYVVVPEPVNNRFRQYMIDAKYSTNITDKMTLAARINFTRQIPWELDNKKLNADYATFFKAVCDRITTSITANYDFTDSINLFAGGEYYTDKVEYDKESYNVNTSTNLFRQYSSMAIFAEAILRSSIINLTIGGRFEKHNQFGAAFVPRIALTKVIDDFHFKALLSQSFRAPNLESLRFNDTIRPEITTAIELELGYQLNSTMFVVINGFDVNIQGPILYVYENNRDNYYNFDKTGTRGLELEWRYQDESVSLTANYSYYQAREGSIPPYQVLDYSQNNIILTNKMFLANPQHKITMRGNWQITENFSVAPHFLYFGERYSYGATDTNGNLIPVLYHPTFISNVFLSYKNVLVRDLDICLGVYDIFGVKYQLLQAYNSGHAPLPGPSREIVLKIQYGFNIK